MAAGRKLCTFGMDAAADVSASATWDGVAQRWQLHLKTPAGAVPTVLHQAGQHNVNNALAAAACALAIGAPLTAVAQGLSTFVPVAGRSQLLTIQVGEKNATLIDDSYNANPDSVLAAIRVLASLPGPRWLVLGDMGEVGSEGPRFHAEVGAFARQQGIEHIWAVGALCAHAGAHRHFDSVADVLLALPSQQLMATSILIKGSRFMRMEQVVHALQAGQVASKKDTHAA
jgi:UDP-N-acetylmuramoyl-tripeptide--D-alanyl-D-alanine ligase